MITLAKFSIEEILPYIGFNSPRLTLKSNMGILYSVKASSFRLEVFKRSRKCVSCRKVGNNFKLELQTKCSQEIPQLHLNMFCGHILMTMDHIWPKALGGLTEIDNLQTMCSICNQYKADVPPYNYKRKEWLYK